MTLNVGDRIMYDGRACIITHIGEFYATIETFSTFEPLKYIIPTHKMTMVPIDFTKDKI